MTSRSRSRSPRSPSSVRYRSRSRSIHAASGSPDRRRRHDSRSIPRSPSPPPRRNGRYRSNSRSLSRGHGGDSRNNSEPRVIMGTKIVVERLSKNVRESHLREIFGHYGPILDLDLPMNRIFDTNRGTAYILYEKQEDAEVAIANMHDGMIDGAAIHVSIVLPRRLMSPEPPLARRGANIDPRIPPPSAHRGGRGRGYPGPGGGYNAGGRGGRYSPRYNDFELPRPRSPSLPPPRGPRFPGGGGRHRNPSYGPPLDKAEVVDTSMCLVDEAAATTAMEAATGPPAHDVATADHGQPFSLKVK
ncbi:Serine/arginine-rich splicing factor SR45, partial [Tolypocladium capitatum]